MNDMASRPKRTPFLLQGKGDMGNANSNAISTLLKQARKSGCLNLSNRSLEEVPVSVWQLNLEVPGGGKSVSLDDNSDAWWDQIDLTKLILASNCLVSVSKDISNFPALNHLDLHDNKLESLPDAIGDLTELQRLNISQNLLKKIPASIFKLKKLRYFHIQQNKVEDLPNSLGDLDSLEELDLSNNMLTIIPENIEFLTNLRSLSISGNLLTKIPPGFGGLKSLKMLDLKQNKLYQLPDELGRLRCLEVLCLQMNQLTKFPKLQNCSSLKELYLGRNKILELPVEYIPSLVSLVILDIRENKFMSVPVEITAMKSLERLDLTNNDLSNLPNVLGTMSNLKTLLLDGNCMRSIRRDIIAKGTEALKKHLVSRMTAEELEAMSPPDAIVTIKSLDDIIKDAIANITRNPSKALVLSELKLQEIPSRAFYVASEHGVTQVNFSKNLLTSFPMDLTLVGKSLTELNLSFNKLSALPPAIGKLEGLLFLTLNNNLLKQLPTELAQAKHLREINISFNRFTRIPDVLYDTKDLEVIILSDGEVEWFRGERLLGLTKLTTLDLHNNKLGNVDRLLGNCTSIKRLRLEGNMLGMPLTRILSKGTEAVMEYLRDQIPKSSGGGEPIF